MKCLYNIGIIFLFFSCHFKSCHSQWNFSPDETEVFDLVDETKVNFYEFLNITQDASQQDVRRSYRQLSKTMHPDKNKTVGAEENFRTLVAMYEVLKNKEKREIYDNVLSNGLPASYLYVPRQLRKMGLLEVSIIISLILTIGHFLFKWGAYAERRLALDEMLPRIQKRLKKQKKKGIEDVSIEHVEELYMQSTNPKPTMYDILPILLARGVYNFIVWVPQYIKHQREMRRIMKEMEETRRREEEEAERKRKEEIKRREEMKKLRKEKNRIKQEEILESRSLSAYASLPTPVFENSQAIEELEAMYDEMDNDDFKKNKNKKKKWTEEDQSTLAKLMTKYPGGTPERWVRISKEMGWSVNEITAKAKAARVEVGSKAKYSAVTQSTGKLLQNKHAAQLSIPDEIISTADGDSSPRKSSKEGKKETKNKPSLQSNTTDASANDTAAMEDKWEQSQQRLLELALQQFPKSTAERWDKVANCVPGKTKDDCVARYRFLAEKISQRKKQSS